LLGFIHLLTNPRIYQNPYSPAEILAIVKIWLEQSAAATPLSARSVVSQIGVALRFPLQSPKSASIRGQATARGRPAEFSARSHSLPTCGL
jgi:hypothetical protein